MGMHSEHISCCCNVWFGHATSVLSKQSATAVVNGFLDLGILATVDTSYEFRRCPPSGVWILKSKANVDYLFVRTQ